MDTNSHTTHQTPDKSIFEHLEIAESIVQSLNNELEQSNNDQTDRAVSQQADLIAKIRAEIDTLKSSYNAKLMEQEEKILQLTQQTQTSGDKVKEYEAWKNKYSGLEQSVLRVPGLVSENERLTAEINKLHVVLSDYKTIQTQNSKLNSQLIAVTTERDELEAEIEERDKELEEVTENLEGQINVLTNEKAGLMKELSRLSLIIEDKIKEIDQLKASIQELEKINQQHQAMNVPRQNVLETSMRNSRHRGTKRGSIAAQLDDSIDHGEPYVVGSRQSVPKKDNLLSELRAKVAAYEIELGGFQDLKTKLALFTTENERLSTLLVERSRELEALKITYAQNAGVGSEVSGMVDEQNALNKALMEKQKEVQALKIIVAEFEKERKDVGGMKGEILLASENQRLNSLITEKTELINALRQRVAEHDEEKVQLIQVIRENEHAIASLKPKLMDNERQSVIIHELKAELLFANTERERMSNSLATLNEKSNEIESLRLRIFHLQTENASLGGVKLQLRHAEDEINRLKSVIFERDAEIQDLKLHATLVGQIEHKINLLVTEKERLTSERDQINEMLAGKMREVGEMSAQLENAGMDRQRLREVVMEKSRENEGLKTKTAMITHLEQKSQDIERENYHLKNENMFYRQEIERVAGLLGEKTKEFNETIGKLEEKEQSLMQLRSSFDRERMYSEEVKMKLISMAAEIDQLKQFIADRDRTIAGYTARASQYGGMEFKIENVIMERDKWAKETEVLRSRVFELERENMYMNELKDKIVQMNAYNERVKEVFNEKMKEIGLYREKLAEYSQLEENLKEITAERDKLGRIMVEKLREIEDQKALISKLKGAATSGSENEGLNGMTNEKNKVVEGWQGSEKSSLNPKELTLSSTDDQKTQEATIISGLRTLKSPTRRSMIDFRY